MPATSLFSLREDRLAFIFSWQGFRLLKLCGDPSWAAFPLHFVRLSDQQVLRQSAQALPCQGRMEALHFFRRLYSLDTLDTRLTTSSQTPLTVATDESPEKSTSERGVETNTANLPPGASPSKWRTPEFYFYHGVIILVIPQMFRSVMNVSRRRYAVYTTYMSCLITHSFTSQLLQIRGLAFTWMDTRSQSCA